MGELTGGHVYMTCGWIDSSQLTGGQIYSWQVDIYAVDRWTDMQLTGRQIYQYRYVARQMSMWVH